MAYKGFPRAMVVAGIVLAAIMIAEALYLSVTGLEKDRESVVRVERLHVDGTALVNESGEKVTLTGISFGWHNLWPRFYNRQAVINLNSEWGCRLFRASIGADDLHETLNGTSAHPGYISDPDTALDCLYAVVDGAIECGAYVIVDWHSHVLHLAEAREFFSTVASKYAGVPNVMYELFNEPVDDSWDDLKSYAEDLIGLIREYDSEAIIMMGCPKWDQSIDLPAADPIKGWDNIMYTMHFYAGTHGQWLRDRTDAALAAGLPVFVSECAASEASGDGILAEDMWKEWTSWMHDRGLSYVMWSVSDKNETCSMFTGEALSEGPWPDEVIKPWGLMARGEF